MTYYAEIKNNKVIRVIVASQEIINKNYSGEWIETFMEFKNNPKKNYAGINFTLDSDGDFIGPKPTTLNNKHEVYLNPTNKIWIIRNKITKEIILSKIL